MELIIGTWKDPTDIFKYVGKFFMWFIFTSISFVKISILKCLNKLLTLNFQLFYDVGSIVTTSPLSWMPLFIQNILCFLFCWGWRFEITLPTVWDCDCHVRLSFFCFFEDKNNKLLFWQSFLLLFLPKFWPSSDSFAIRNAGDS